MDAGSRRGIRKIALPLRKPLKPRNFYVGALLLWGALVCLAVNVPRLKSALRKAAAASLPAPAFEPMRIPAEYGWSVRALDGRVMDMAEGKGKTVFLNFWATWCGPCRQEMPGIQKLSDELKNDPRILFVCISDEDPEKVRSFMERKRYTFPVYTEDKSDRPSVYHHRAIPTTYILSPGGRIEARQVGSADWSAPEAAAFLRSFNGDGI